MKKIFCILFVIAALAVSCNRKGSGNNGEQPAENSYNTPEEAFEQARKNLPSLLNDNQRKTFGLDSEDSIKTLEKKTAIPVTYVAFSQLQDSTLKRSDDAIVYALGNNGGPRICISVGRQGDKWIQSIIGLKKYVTLFQQQPDIKRIIDVPGLEMSFAEITTNDTTAYFPVTDYPEAKMYRQEFMSEPVLLRRLEQYRMELERKYGKDFTEGTLDR